MLSGGITLCEAFTGRADEPYGSRYGLYFYGVFVE